MRGRRQRGQPHRFQARDQSSLIVGHASQGLGQMRDVIKSHDTSRLRHGIDVPCWPYFVQYGNHFRGAHRIAQTHAGECIRFGHGMQDEEVVAHMADH